ncbi:hypothetical protein BKA65DRAFT_453065 [Rhexocercosporidium sp. MPI-PUGE-AT-0058]|nr:hypothetical protein BKA65DRAFT_453065 [Rhexocercosporidium sp. MPI-PUGE-AT-0058]
MYCSCLPVCMSVREFHCSSSYFVRSARVPRDRDVYQEPLSKDRFVLFLSFSSVCVAAPSIPPWFSFLSVRTLPPTSASSLD